MARTGKREKKNEEENSFKKGENPDQSEAAGTGFPASKMN